MGPQDLSLTGRDWHPYCDAWRQEAAGISDRPLDEERALHEAVPPRGERKR